MFSSGSTKKTIALALVLTILWPHTAFASGVTINSGASVTESGSPKITTNGDWDNNGTFTAGSGTVELNGSSSTLLEAGTSSFNNLVINKTDAADANDNVTVQTDSLTVTGALAVTDGELVQGVTSLTLSGLTVAAAGKYSNSSTGDLTLAGAVANAGTIAFDSGGGGPGGTDDILIRSSVNGTQRNWQGAGTFSMTDVDVKDQTAIGGTPPNITVNSGTNSGNNVNWLFGTVTLAGTAYADKTEAATLNNKALRIVLYHSGVAASYTTTTDALGQFSLAMADVASGDPVLIYLNDEAQEGNLIYVSDGLSVANLKLYGNEVALRNDAGTGVSNANLANLDDGDDDVKYSVSSGAATFESAFELFIFTGSTYKPAGDVTLNDIDLNGDFKMEANAVTCSGVWDATGGAYSSTGTVTFSATAAKNLTANGASALASFNNVVFSGAGGQWNLQDNLDVDGNLTITTGTLNANAQSINVSGNWTNTASFLSAAGTVFFDGASTQTFTSTGTGIAADDTTRDFDNLTVSGSTLQVVAGSELEVDGTLQVNTGKFLDMNAQTLDLNGTLSNDGTVILEGSETLGLGTWDTNSGTTRFVGDSVTLTSLIPTYFNLELSQSSGSQTYTLPDTNVVVNGVLTVTAGTLAFDNDKNLRINDTGATGIALSVAPAGTLSNTGTGDLTLAAAVSNSGTITFDSSDDAGNGISILSTASPTQRNWQGSGAFNMTDVTVQDQTATGGSPASITASSSTNGGNNVNWLFAGGALTGGSVTPANLEAGHTSNNTVAFTTTNALPSNGKIRVTFPAGFNVAGVTTATSAADLDGTLSVSVAGQVVTITRSGGTNFAAGGTVDDLVLAGVVNPVAVGATGPFTLSTLDASSVIIDTGSAAGVTIVPSTSTNSSSQFIDSASVSTDRFTISSTTTGKVYMTVSDSDENANGALAETVNVTVTSAATGDQETVVLTETGVNTGIFTNTSAGLHFDADDAPAAGNGTLETRDGDTITMTYTDDDDATDVTTDTAVISASQELVLTTLTATPESVTIGQSIMFTGTIENRTSDALSDFRSRSNLPPGIVFKSGSAKVDSGSVQASPDGSTVVLSGFTPLAAGAKRTFTFQCIAGSGIQPGEYDATTYVQFNPIISNTAFVTLRVNPDPIFHIGTLIGKVFWDVNKNGVQDEGEIGIPNATVATEQGYVITTDEYGRYHIPDFMSGRHMVKIDRASLPGGSRLTTPEAVVVSQTDAMLTKVNFGVVVPEAVGTQFDKEREADVTLMVRRDPATPRKDFGLEFFEILRPEKKTGLSLIGGEELEKTQGAEYDMKDPDNHPVLPFRIHTNYPAFVKSWKFEISRYEEDQSVVFKDSSKRRRKSIAVASETGAPTASAFLYKWDLPFEDARGKEIRYEVRVTLEDEKGNTDEAVYDIKSEDVGDTVHWKLEPVDSRESIPVKGSVVVVDGTTHANKVVSLFGRDDLSATDGKFSSSIILPEGGRDIPVQLYLERGKDPVTVTRHIDLRDTAFFWVGFSEMEYGHLNAKGNVQSLTPEDKARFQSEWYDESRIAYYLKGKIKGKYLITASVDTQREKRELFRDLKPEDYYAVYGDKSTVTADANDTQDKYFLLLEVDKSYFKYGNFQTDFNDTEYAGYTRTLHGAKLHYETLSTGADGKPLTVVKLFSATARQLSARNEFAATGGSLYYLNNKQVVQGSEKVRAIVRDKVSGLVLSERALSRGQDYSMDYEEGRLRLYRPVGIFTYESDSILSTELLPGNPQYLAIDYEYTSRAVLSNMAQGARVTQSLLGNQLRIGGTYVTEEKDFNRYTLQGTDAQIRLPLGTEIGLEEATSSLQSSGEFFSSNGGLSFTEAGQTVTGADSGRAYKIEAVTHPWLGSEISAYYRVAGPGFAANGTRSESGTESLGFQLGQSFGAYGEALLRYQEQSILEGASGAVLLRPSGSDSGIPNGSQKSTLFQYKVTRGAWDWTAEYRDTIQPDKNENLAGLQGLYHLNDRTRLTVAGQKSFRGPQNDQVRGGVEYDITKDFTVRAQQAAGTRGVGSLFGLDSRIQGLARSFSHGTGSLKDETPGDKNPTTVGFSHKFGKDSEIKMDRGLGKSKTQSLQLTRTSADGRVLELTRSHSGTTETSTYSETEDLGEGTSRYNQSSTSRDRLTGKTSHSATQGYKASLLGGKTTVFRENESATDGVSTRDISRQGIGLKQGEFGHVALSYERNEDRTADSGNTLYQVGRLVYDYFEYDKLQWTEDIELRSDQRSLTRMEQLFSSGKAQWTPTEEWALVGRYEWTFTQDMVTGAKSAQFSEIQGGFAYRPVKNDRWNLIGEYKYLADQAPTGQIDLNGEAGARRQIARGEIAYDLNPKITLIEKIAMRDAKSSLKSGSVTESLSFFAAQRVNYHVTDRWDIGAEYRYLGQSLAEDSTHGLLLETSYRVTDAFRFTVGYGMTRFTSQAAHDLDVQTNGVYVRVFYDAMEELRGILEKKRQKTKEAAGQLETELERAKSIPGSEKDIQEMRARLDYAHSLMEKMLYEEAIEVLRDGLDLYQSARLYSDRAQKLKAQFDFYLRQGEMFKKYGLYEQSFRSLEKAYRIDAFHPGLLELMSEVRREILKTLELRRQIRAEQRKEFERLKEIKEVGGLIYDTIQMHYATGRKYFDRGLYEDAMQEWQMGYDLAKRVENDQERMASERKDVVDRLHAINERAEGYFKAGDYEKAKDTLKEGVELLKKVQ